MGKPKVLQILSMYHEQGEIVLREGVEVIRTDHYDIPHLCRLVLDVEGIVLRAPAQITREVIDANPNLKVISGAGVGLDNIDVAYATAHGIPVLHAPSVNKVSTAEHAVMLMLALSKNVIRLHDEMSRGDYASRTRIPTYELKGKKAGLVGFGHIAQEVAKRLKLGFDMDVTAWVRGIDPVKHGLAHELGIRLTTRLEDVFAQSDFVSLHIPLNEQTRYSIDRKLFSLMKSTAYLINTARGAVVHQDDLFAALQEGRIAGAGLDVFDPEPPAKGHPLLSLPNVIVTPHVGGTTVECNYITSTTVARNVIRVLQGERPEHIGNPEVLDERYPGRMTADRRISDN
ncbi:D-3-phosphoglycerate dehydrogenase [Paenibacillus sp. UNCCL117]|uniref:hydroxyacid dehydrogenase n=1 Tax=unclassified Paenibacillus TaxID=185978 RepID=UPI00088F99CA|nr:MULTISPECIES: hydroxyacid dehydrogenase [unclassified Paenibacillus]SDE67620.1 D-3-phosphoglycerate dehydrogenase [Paenibacillus sp. cl123]SFW70750.1 D-3-phosphoglycerate dehydrogenase [Paenibacillus sp. UNCCL117]